MIPFGRFAFNFLVYLVFGGAIFAFVAMRAAAERPAFSAVVTAALALALWSGTLTTALEVVVARDPQQVRRSAIAAALGALSLGGFGMILSLLAWHAPQYGFVATGVVAGALMHGARAFARGQELADDDDDDAAGQASSGGG